MGQGPGELTIEGCITSVTKTMYFLQCNNCFKPMEDIEGIVLHCTRCFARTLKKYCKPVGSVTFTLSQEGKETQITAFDDVLEKILPDCIELCKNEEQMAMHLLTLDPVKISFTRDNHKATQIVLSQPLVINSNLDETNCESKSDETNSDVYDMSTNLIQTALPTRTRTQSKKK